ncbi:hypothetical protein AbraIFM66950_003905 [Aspergillus brasiliensis]|nr:hypothetical protein AbraIFM66950_003905 [Aspergillus brasiliensis]
MAPGGDGTSTSSSFKSPADKIVEDALEQVQIATQDGGPLRKLFRSHLIASCNDRKLKEFHESKDKYKNYVVSYLAQKMAIDLVESFGRELAREQYQARCGTLEV